MCEPNGLEQPPSVSTSCLSDLHPKSTLCSVREVTVTYVKIRILMWPKLFTVKKKEIEIRIWWDPRCQGHLDSTCSSLFTYVTLHNAC